MTSWKNDPLHREIFHEVRSLWDEVDEATRPLLYRVEERPSQDFSQPGRSSRPAEVWIYDDSGFRVVPLLGAQAHEFGAVRRGCFEYGLVWFAIASDRAKVRLAYCLGPEVFGEITYEVELDGDDLYLMADTGSLNS